VIYSVVGSKFNDMKVTEETIQKLKTKWDDYGYCPSCRWHSGFYEVEEDLVEQLKDDDFETDRNGNKYIVAYCKYATENDENHRDIEIYIDELL
jgi:hypothetical protein